jgi:hypothetical protein
MLAAHVRGAIPCYTGFAGAMLHFRRRFATLMPAIGEAGRRRNGIAQPYLRRPPHPVRQSAK